MTELSGCIYFLFDSKYPSSTTLSQVAGTNGENSARFVRIIYDTYWVSLNFFHRGDWLRGWNCESFTDYFQLPVNLRFSHQTSFKEVFSAVYYSALRDAAVLKKGLLNKHINWHGATDN